MGCVSEMEGDYHSTFNKYKVKFENLEMKIFSREEFFYTFLPACRIYLCIFLKVLKRKINSERVLRRIFKSQFFI